MVKVFFVKLYLGQRELNSLDECILCIHETQVQSSAALRSSLISVGFSPKTKKK